MHAPTIGFIGTGDFASYLITALRNGGCDSRIVLSPYSSDKARKLSDAHNCSVASSEASLCDESDWIVLAVRPAQFADAVSTLRMRPNQLLISAVAGVTVEALRQALVVEVPIVRIMPASYIQSTGDGLIPVYPASHDVSTVLAAAGRIVAFDTEAQFELAMLGACLAGWMYGFMAEQETWFVESGLSENQARLIVAGNIAGASSDALARSNTALASISDGIATQGTFTRAGLEHLLRADAAKPWLEALDILKQRLVAKDH